MKYPTPEKDGLIQPDFYSSLIWFLTLLKLILTMIKLELLVNLCALLEGFVLGPNH